MTYGIYFDRGASTDALRGALQSLYGIAPSLVYVGPYEDLSRHPGPDPVALITPTDGQFGYEFSAGDQLAAATGVDERELARALCMAADTRALIDDGTAAPDYWILMAGDGSSGRVQTDPDADGLVVLYALEPIAGAPELPVVPPPSWAITW